MLFAALILLCIAILLLAAGPRPIVAQNWVAVVLALVALLIVLLKLHP